jgi:hypothetical protein
MSQHTARTTRDHCLAPERVDAPIHGARYRALFEDLPPVDVDEEALHELGRPGGPCDLGGSVDPNWTPTLPARRAGAFGLSEILVPVP